jgi:hypothetical protein
MKYSSTGNPYSPDPSLPSGPGRGRGVPTRPQYAPDNYNYPQDQSMYQQHQHQVQNQTSPNYYFGSRPLNQSTSTLPNSPPTQQPYPYPRVTYPTSYKHTAGPTYQQPQQTQVVKQSMSMSSTNSPATTLLKAITSIIPKSEEEKKDLELKRDVEKTQALAERSAQLLMVMDGNISRMEEERANLVRQAAQISKPKPSSRGTKSSPQTMTTMNKRLVTELANRIRRLDLNLNKERIRRTETEAMRMTLMDKDTERGFKGIIQEMAAHTSTMGEKGETMKDIAESIHEAEGDEEIDIYKELQERQVNNSLDIPGGGMSEHLSDIMGEIQEYNEEDNVQEEGEGEGNTEGDFQNLQEDLLLPSVPSYPIPQSPYGRAQTNNRVMSQPMPARSGGYNNNNM